MSSVEVSAGSDALSRARMLLSVGRHQDALVVARQCIASRPGEPEPLIVAAFGELGLGRLDAAEATAREAVGASPSMPEAHRALVAVLTSKAYKSGEYATGNAGRKAMAAAKGLVAMAPTSASSYWAMADACVAAHKPRAAVRASDTALELAPNSTQTWLVRARAARCAFDFQVAESAVREALRLQPNNYLANNELGTILRLRGRTAEALQQFSSTASMDPVARPARANFVRYGVLPLQLLVLAVTSPVLLVVRSPIAWIWGSIAVNAALWRAKPTKGWLERRAFNIALWRSRRPQRRSRRKEALVPARTPVQAYRSSRAVTVLFFLLLVWVSVLATGAAAQLAPRYLPLCLMIDVPTGMYGWWLYKRLKPRPTLPT
jgi:tetratricopeptide (TPR) repeat protein